MDLYFKLKTISEFVIPLAIVALIIAWGIYALTKSWLKSRLMQKLGYTYDKGLGNNVAYEFQPHWVKGEIKINCRKIDSMKYRQIKKFVESENND